MAELTMDALKNAYKRLNEKPVISPRYLIISPDVWVPVLYIVGDKKAVELHDFLVTMAAIGVRNITSEYNNEQVNTCQITQTS